MLPGRTPQPAITTIRPPARRTSSPIIARPAKASGAWPEVSRRSQPRAMTSSSAASGSAVSSKARWKVTERPASRAAAHDREVDRAGRGQRADDHPGGAQRRAQADARQHRLHLRPVIDEIPAARAHQHVDRQRALRQYFAQEPLRGGHAAQFEPFAQLDPPGARPRSVAHGLQGGAAGFAEILLHRHWGMTRRRSAAREVL